MRDSDIRNTAQQVIDGTPVSRQQALALARTDDAQVEALFAGAARIRDHFVGRESRVCGIIAAKVGGCSEDCAFCSQSARFDTHVEGRTVVDREQVFEAGMQAADEGACYFGIVNSGRGPTNREIIHWGDTIARIEESGRIRPCASLGTLKPGQAQHLREVGLRRYHHNLETSRRHFPNIVSTHTYDERLETCRQAKEAGLELCSGVLLGMGETWEDRIDVAMDLRELDPDSVPINFLVPMDGTPLAGTPLMPAMECLKAIAVFRFILAKPQMRVCGGREACLGDMQNRIFDAGADSFLLGNYLTTCGRDPEPDRRMVRESGFELKADAPNGGPREAVEASQHHVSD